MSGAPLPDGFVRITIGGSAVVSRAEHADDARTLLGRGSLHEAAAHDPRARALAGRGVAYAIALPCSGVRAVVRHNRHGGLLAPLTRDLFLPPTRAPLELATSLRLAAAGVRTPAVLMYAVYRTGLLARADVATREVEDGNDLASFMMPGTPAELRRDAWRAARTLVQTLSDAGARHHDLNVKNVLLAPSPSGVLQGWVLDVDRVVFGVPGSSEMRQGNAARLVRSARKWRDERGAELDERDLVGL